MVISTLEAFKLGVAVGFVIASILVWAVYWFLNKEEK